MTEQYSDHSAGDGENGRKRAVFLDRDGVLNRSEIREGRPYAPRRLEDFHIENHAGECIRRLRDMGFLTIVVTNQKDVEAGLTDKGVVDAMHVKLREAVPLDAIKMCTCLDECPCYKPNPGMLLEAAEEFDIDLTASYMIGDRWRDVGAGKRAGCTTVFIDYNYDEELRDRPDITVADLPGAVAEIEKAERHS